MKISRENYHELEEIDGVPVLRASFIKQVAKTGSVAAARVPLKPSPAMELGTAVHAGLLEPDKFDVYKPRTWDLRTKAGKEKQAEVENDGSIYLNISEYEMVCRMLESARSRPAIVEHLDHQKAEKELPLLSHHPESQPFYIKSMIDLYHPGYLIDVKTTRSIKDFDRAFFDLFYDIQMMVYAIVLTANKKPVKAVKMIVIENQPPYQSQLVDVPEKALLIGKARLHEALGAIFEAWQAKDDRVAEISELVIPGWLMSRYRDEVEQ